MRSDRPDDGDMQDGGAAGAEPQPQADGAQAAPAPAADPEADAGRERYLRLAAEYDNYRKRTERERSESWVRAQAQIVEKLLEPLDDLQRVAHFSEGASAASLLEGVQMVERKLLRVLEGAGLQPLDAEGKPFDPSVHEALTMVPTENRDEDHTVADVFQKGYQFKDVLLRPARVRVKQYQG